MILEPARRRGFAFLRKQTPQLASKSASSRRAVRGAAGRRPVARWAHTPTRWPAAWPTPVRDVPGVTITRAVEANAVFAASPSRSRRRLQSRCGFYVWDEATGEVRWMCSWSTSAEDVDDFAQDVRQALGAAAVAAG